MAMAGWFAAPVPTMARAGAIDLPSLSVADGDDGRLLLRCFAGCDFVDILDELKHRGLVDGPNRFRRDRFTPIAPSPCRAQP